MTSTPHDALFKYFFEQAEHAASLFRHHLPPAFADLIPWDQLTREPTEFLGEDLDAIRTDVLFSVRISDQTLYLYLLLEHQSTNHKLMPLRMAHSVDRITQHHMLDHAGDVPLVIPFVVSHAIGGWTAARSYQELIALDLEALGVARHALNLELIIEDLAHLSNVDLKARGLGALATLAFCALRDARDPFALVREALFWADQLVEALLSPNGMEAIRRVSRYLWLTTSPMNFEQFRATLRPHIPTEKQEVIMELTYADEMIRRGRVEGRVEGEAEGRARGEAEGQAKLLAHLIALKFGELSSEHQLRLTNADPTELLRYAQQFVSARTLDEVFTAPRA